MKAPNFTRWKPVLHAAYDTEVLLGWPGKSRHVDVGIIPAWASTPFDWHIRDTVLADETVQPPTHWQKIPGLNDDRWQPMDKAPCNMEMLVGWRSTPGYVDFATCHKPYEIDYAVWTFRNNQDATEGEDDPDFWMVLDEVPS